jgi:CTP:molybdopterin cytidylyltransferase MocA
VVVLLADMPRISAVQVDRLIDAFDPKQPAIVVPHAQRPARQSHPLAARVLRVDAGR